MSEDEHGIDIEEDTDLETADGPDEDAAEDAERARQAAERDAAEDLDRQQLAGEDEEREDAARAAENPDAHRDEEPFSSE